MSGTFTTVAAANNGPTIGLVVVSQTKGRITWNEADPDGISGATLAIGGTVVPNVAGPFTAASGVNYSAPLGLLAAGDHAYTITATDRLGNKLTINGSFTLLAASGSGPTIGLVVVSQAKGRMSWNAVDPEGVTGCTLALDGILVSNIAGPFAAASGVNFSASIASLASGNHTYKITATDRTGSTSSLSGSFTLAASPSAARNAVFSEPSLFALSGSAKVNWVYDLAALSSSTQSSSDKAVDAVLAGY